MTRITHLHRHSSVAASEHRLCYQTAHNPEQMSAPPPGPEQKDVQKESKTDVVDHSRQDDPWRLKKITEADTESKKLQKTVDDVDSRLVVIRQQLLQQKGNQSAV